MLPFSILGLSVWPQYLDCSPFSPHLMPSQPDPGPGEGTPIPALLLGPHAGS